MKSQMIWMGMAAAAFGREGWTFAPDEGWFRMDIRPSIEAVVWAADDPAPALLATDDSVFFNPRLHLDADAAMGESWFIHGSLRADRGFDGGEDEDGDLRLDEIFLRWRACDDQRFNIQIGRFPTVFGAWQSGHDFFDDPFLLAPLPYSQIIGVSTRSVGSMSAASIAGRAAGRGSSVAGLPKDKWGSMIWGPAYGTGASVFGSTDCVDYAFEVKNCGLGSHPDSWTGNGFEDPAFTARLGYRPDAAWAFGVSASRGPWLEDNQKGFDRDDFQQTSLGFDARWSHGDWILTSELVLSEFETVDAGDLRAASWFVGGRWKVSPGVWIAPRIGWLVTEDANGPAGKDVEWQPGVWRAELAAGWRVSSNLLLKAEYAFTHTDDGGAAGEHLCGLGVGWRF